jgi:hypothetical protein
MDRMEEAFGRVGEVLGNDSNPLVESAGVDPAFCETRRESLRKIEDELGFWERIYRKRHGVVPTTVQQDDADEDDGYEDEESDESIEVDDRDEVTN